MVRHPRLPPLRGVLRRVGWRSGSLGKASWVAAFGRGRVRKLVDIDQAVGLPSAFAFGATPWPILLRTGAVIPPRRALRKEVGA